MVGMVIIGVNECGTVGKFLFLHNEWIVLMEVELLKTKGAAVFLKGF